MKSKNLGIISDADLRLNITTYYDNHVKWILQSLTDVEQAFSRDWVPEIKAEFTDFKFKQYASPRNPID